MKTFLKKRDLYIENILFNVYLHGIEYTDDIEVRN